MSCCTNPTCDAVRAGALQVAGTWDALAEAAHFGDPQAQETLRLLAEAAPHLTEALQALADELGDDD